MPIGTAIGLNMKATDAERRRRGATSPLARQPVDRENRGVLSDNPVLLHQALLGEAVDLVANVAVTVYDDEGRLIAANEQAARMVGLTREELLRRDIGDFTEGGFDRSVLTSSRPREGVRLVHRPGGTRVPVAFMATPTKVAGLDYAIAFAWELLSDDPRAVGAR